MNNYFGGTEETGGGERDDNAITDARYEAYREAIVSQGEKLVRVIGDSITLSGN